LIHYPTAVARKSPGWMVLPAGHFLFIAVAVAPTLPPATRKRKGRWTVTEPSNAPATHRQQAAREL